MAKVKNRRELIDKIREIMQERDDFGELKHIRCSFTNEEYLWVSDITGDSIMLDIEDYTNAQVWHCIAQIECGIMPSNAIQDKPSKLAVAKLFR